MSTFILLLVWGCGPNRTTPVRITLEGDDYRSAPAAPIRPSRPVSQGNGDSLAPAGWIPARRVEDKDRWEGIIVHHSGTVSGNAALIDKWHKQQGWDGLGYHFVIDNGQGGADGRLEVGFRWRDQLTGAHCREATGDDNYWNEHTIGICLVGNFEEHRPTAAQYDSLAQLVSFLQKRYNIPTNKIIGHRDVKATECPGRLFSWAELRRRLREE